MKGQDQVSVSQPPSAGPIIGAITTPSPNTAIAAALFSFGNISKMIACDIGIIPPPPIPCRILANKIIVIDVDNPQRTEATVKIVTLIKK